MRSYVDEGVAEKVRAAGGEIFAISSEPQTLSSRAQVEWKLDFETVGDPHHEISDLCRERGWLDLFFNERLSFLKQSKGDGQDWEPTHPKGYFQPGVLVLGQEGQVLYRWRGVPTHNNIGGAVARPTASHVWSQIEEVSRAGTQGGEDAPLDEDPPLDVKGIPWALFVPLLIANGWFLNPRGFRTPAHIPIAALRVLGFTAAWLAAFVWLPTLPVLLVLALWAAYITPKIIWVGREFQNESVAK